MPIPNAPAWEPWLGLLQKVSLFRGISPDDLCRLLLQLSPTVQRYPAGDIILLSGQENASIRIVLEGSITASKISPGGQTVTMAHMQPGGIFGDVLSGSHQKSPVTILARTECTALFLPYEKILHPCKELHSCHSLLLQNLVSTISDKYFTLNHRIDLLILKSLRAKLCAYLMDMRMRAGQDTFTIPFTRTELAEYLNCERSALSRELSRMQAEGLIETYRSSFKILDVNRLSSQCPQ